MIVTSRKRKAQRRVPRKSLDNEGTHMFSKCHIKALLSYFRTDSPCASWLVELCDESPDAFPAPVERLPTHKPRR